VRGTIFTGQRAFLAVATPSAFQKGIRRDVLVFRLNTTSSPLLVYLHVLVEYFVGTKSVGLTAGVAFATAAGRPPRTKCW
jgi:hypothetical protein